MVKISGEPCFGYASAECHNSYPWKYFQGIR